METLQDRLKRARALRGLSQKEVATRAGIKQPTYSDLESGESSSSTKLAKIAEALGVNLIWLSTGKGDMDAPLPTSPQLDDDEKYLLRLFEKLTADEDRHHVIEIVSAYVRGERPAKAVDASSLKQFNALEGDIEAYFTAHTEKRQKEIQLEIGGRVIQMFDQRQRQGGPPDGIEKRRSRSGKQ